MSADRELLELAAKAMGVKRMEYRDDVPFVSMGYPPLDDWEAWNPEVDDGDALRLAASLGMRVDFGYADAGGKGPAVAVWLKGDFTRFPQFWQATYPDVMRNARMTITRAAAHVAKAMP